MIRANISDTHFSFTSPLSNRSHTDLIVLHHTGGKDIDASAEQIHHWHIDAGYCGIGYHFVIRKNGTVERGRPVNSIGSHAFGSNSHSVGIHLCGNFEEVQPTDAQIEMASMLIANLCADFNIPIDRNHIKGHFEVDPDGLRGTSCPGKFLTALHDTIVGKANWYRYNSKTDSVDSTPVPVSPSADMLSTHFGKNEFWCRGLEQGTCHCNHSRNINPRLLELLEQLRSNIGNLPLFIHSGYRCPEHNLAVGGARFSQHTAGNAADLAVPSGLSFDDFHWYVSQLPFDGIGLYPRGSHDGWIHVDVRDGGIGSKIYWNG